MKRIISIALLFLLLPVFAGCAGQNAYQPEPFGSAGTAAPSVAGTQGCQSLPTLLTIEEYNKYIALKADSNTFINYEMVKTLGQFVCFVDKGHEKCQEYLYGLLDKNGYHISLIVYPTTDLATEYKSDPPQSALEHDDMRTNQSRGETCTINGIQYNYYAGNLYSIVWHTDTHRFTIEAGRTIPLSAYPNGMNATVLSRLLSAKTAEAAVAEFNASVALARQQAMAEKTG